MAAESSLEDGLKDLSLDDAVKLVEDLLEKGPSADLKSTHAYLMQIMAQDDEGDEDQVEDAAADGVDALGLLSEVVEDFDEDTWDDDDDDGIILIPISEEEFMDMESKVVAAQEKEVALKINLDGDAENSVNSSEDGEGVGFGFGDGDDDGSAPGEVVTPTERDREGGGDDPEDLFAPNGDEGGSSQEEEGSEGYEEDLLAAEKELDTAVQGASAVSTDKETGGLDSIDLPPPPPTANMLSNSSSKSKTSSSIKQRAIIGQEHYIGPGDGRTYGVFNLKVIFDPYKTGFEPSKSMHAPPGTVIAGRYEVDEVLGTAAFSTALQCCDLSLPEDHEDCWVCLKCIKHGKDYFDQSLDEIKLLQYINSHCNPDKKHILRLIDFFYHKEHLFIVTELLRDNLYEFGRSIRYSGQMPYFVLPRLKMIARQVLEALEYIHSLGLIHCDMKPENIVMKSYSKCLVKIIDFGSSCFNSDRLTTYIQSRSYRAPEVVLGHQYDGRIDIWSVGAILAEMHTGYVLFQNDSVACMLSRIIAILGPFPPHMLDQCKDAGKYFTAAGHVYEPVGSMSTERQRIMRKVKREQEKEQQKEKEKEREEKEDVEESKADGEVENGDKEDVDADADTEEEEEEEVDLSERSKMGMDRVPTHPEGFALIYPKRTTLAARLHLDHIVQKAELSNALQKKKHIEAEAEAGEEGDDNDKSEKDSVQDGLEKRFHLSADEEDALLFLDFVRYLLEVDPSERPTATEALRHPWFIGMEDFDLKALNDAEGRWAPSVPVEVQGAQGGVDTADNSEDDEEWERKERERK